MLQEAQATPTQRKRCVTQAFVDHDGVKHHRGSTADIQTLQARTFNAILDVNHLEQNRALHVLVSTACYLYASAAYPQALHHLTRALDQDPDLDPYLFYYKRVCERVLATPLTTEERAYEARCVARRKLPTWLRWLRPVDVRGRCKWCGRYTQYIDPNIPTYGIHREQNCCQHCQRMYPMPSVAWDSPDGRAYSYYRMSHGDDEAFYDEFEQDYAPNPLCQRRRRL